MCSPSLNQVSSPVHHSASQAEPLDRFIECVSGLVSDGRPVQDIAPRCTVSASLMRVMVCFRRRRSSGRATSNSLSRRARRASKLPSIRNLPNRWSAFKSRYAQSVCTPTNIIIRKRTCNGCYGKCCACRASRVIPFLENGALERSS